MIQQTFENGNFNNRNVIIRIDDDYIYFYFEKDYFRHIEWLENADEDEFSEEEREPTEFYGFDRERWKVAKEDFPAHMMRKNWFTPNMRNFINKNTGTNL